MYRYSEVVLYLGLDRLFSFLLYVVYIFVVFLPIVVSKDYQSEK